MNHKALTLLLAWVLILSCAVNVTIGHPIASSEREQTTSRESLPPLSRTSDSDKRILRKIAHKLCGSSSRATVYPVPLYGIERYPTPPPTPPTPSTPRLSPSDGRSRSSTPSPRRDSRQSFTSSSRSSTPKHHLMTGGKLSIKEPGEHSGQRTQSLPHVQGKGKAIAKPPPRSSSSSTSSSPRWSAGPSSPKHKRSLVIDWPEAELRSAELVRIGARDFFRKLGHRLCGSCINKTKVWPKPNHGSMPNTPSSGGSPVHHSSHHASPQHHMSAPHPTSPSHHKSTPQHHSSTPRPSRPASPKHRPSNHTGVSINEPHHSSHSRPLVHADPKGKGKAHAHHVPSPSSSSSNSPGWTPSSGAGPSTHHKRGVVSKRPATKMYKSKHVDTPGKGQKLAARRPSSSNSHRRRDLQKRGCLGKLKSKLCPSFTAKAVHPMALSEPRPKYGTPKSWHSARRPLHQPSGHPTRQSPPVQRPGSRLVPSATGPIPQPTRPLTIKEPQSGLAPHRTPASTSAHMQDKDKGKGKGKVPAHPSPAKSPSSSSSSASSSPRTPKSPAWQPSLTPGAGPSRSSHVEKRGCTGKLKGRMCSSFTAKPVHPIPLSELPARTGARPSAHVLALPASYGTARPLRRPSVGTLSPTPSGRHGGSLTINEGQRSKPRGRHGLYSGKGKAKAVDHSPIRSSSSSSSSSPGWTRTPTHTVGGAGPSGHARSPSPTHKDGKQAIHRPLSLWNPSSSSAWSSANTSPSSRSSHGGGSATLSPHREGKKPMHSAKKLHKRCLRKMFGACVGDHIYPQYDRTSHAHAMPHNIHAPRHQVPIAPASAHSTPLHHSPQKHPSPPRSRVHTAPPRQYTQAVPVSPEGHRRPVRGVSIQEPTEQSQHRQVVQGKGKMPVQHSPSRSSSSSTSNSPERVHHHPSGGGESSGHA